MAYGHHPPAFGLHPGFVHQDGERDAGPFGVGEQTVEQVQPGLHGLVEHRVEEAVARAFQETDLRDHRVALERSPLELQRAFDQAMDHQAVLVGIELWPAAVVDLEMQPVRRDRAAQMVVRRAGEAEGRRKGHPMRGVLHIYPKRSGQFEFPAPACVTGHV